MEHQYTTTGPGPGAHHSIRYVGTLGMGGRLARPDRVQRVENGVHPGLFTYRQWRGGDVALFLDFGGSFGGERKTLDVNKEEQAFDREVFPGILAHDRAQGG